MIKRNSLLNHPYKKTANIIVSALIAAAAEGSTEDKPSLDN
ncbi:hypothetical protein [Jeotgalibacillus soli]|uniref:Uncharacterized protein n=1 Tax=Jeotgalibacillus soli TaxID=889306 RepID=A0A0C2VHA1_9BACL|nr:hypothetical protein [Jeotgalibacillus soli]KIL48252.1 hypothetical protein KP78_17000 [Jeotgalibacillus soli]